VSSFGRPSGRALRALVGLILFWGAVARAHEADLTREVRGTARLGAQGGLTIDLLVSQVLPKGASQLQSFRFDLDRDGRLSPEEGALLGLEMAPTLTRGLVLRAGSAPLVPRAREGAARIEGKQRVRLAVLLTYEVETGTAEPLSLLIEPTIPPTAEPTQVTFAALSPLRTSVRPHTLRPGDAAWALPLQR
jgi:hypothetical protein